MISPRIVVSIVAGCFCACLSGCAERDTPSVAASQAGLVYMFPGIEGAPIWLRDARRGLRDGGVKAEIRLFDWKRPLGNLINLTALPANRVKARDVAAQIAVFHQRFPDAPIDLVGYSGGGGMAVFVAEALPNDVQLHTIVLAQAALSPTYDLTAALSHTDRIVNLYCRSDWLVLGAGTRLLGTMDRQHVVSAGRVGFDAERAVPDPHLRGRLVQRALGAASRRAGHAGGHLGCLGRRWNREMVAPWLRNQNSASVDAEAPAPN